MNDFYRQVADILLFEESAQAILQADKDNVDPVFRSSLDGALNLNRRRLIAAHRVYRDFDFGHEELFLSGLDDFPFLVITAMRTSAMRHP